MLARQTVKKERIVKAWIMLMLALTLPMAAGKSALAASASIIGAARRMQG